MAIVAAGAMGTPQVLAPALVAGGTLVPMMPQQPVQPVDPAAARIRELGPGCELRIIVEDDQHARVKLLSEGPASRRDPNAVCSAEMFGAELIPGHSYLLHGGTRTAVYTWHGCRLQLDGPTKQEYDAPNVVMREYLSCAAVLEQRRQRAMDIDLPAPRVLVCGSNMAGKSSLCQILCNYAMRRERTPIYVDLDTRYSCIRQLQNLPACVSAMPVEHPPEEEPQRRMSYFFGHIDWSDNPKLYQRVVSHLSKVVAAKLAHNTSPEGARTASSGVIINAPFQPTPELLQRIVELYEVDVIFVLDDESLHAALSKMYAGLPKVHGVPKVEVFPLPKAGGVVQMPPKRLRNLRALQVRDYFYGVMKDFSPYSVFMKFDDIELVQLETAQLSAGMLPVGQDSQKSVEFIVRPFSGNPKQLENALIAVVRATSMNEVLFAPLCGLVLVTSVEEAGLQLLSPATPPFPASFLVVGDTKSLKFIDM